MIRRFTLTPEVARRLTAVSKKEGFYFRTLTRTDKGIPVHCEASDYGFDFILNHKNELFKNEL